MKKTLLRSFLISSLAILGLTNKAKADWVIVNNGLSDKTINDLVVYGSTVFAATDAGIFSSSNSGGLWTLIPSTAYAKAFVVSGTNIFAAIQDGAKGVVLSTDGGATWNPVNTGLPYKYNDALAADGSNVFAHDYGKTYISSNNGTLWTEITTLPGFSSIIRSGSMMYASYSLNGSGYNGIYTSIDNGLTWSQPTNTGLGKKIQDLAMIGNTLFATTVSGMYTSVDNGANWAFHTPVNGGDVDNAITLLAQGTNLFVGTPKGVYLTTNNGASYTNVSGSIGTRSVSAFTVLGTNIFAGTVFNTEGIYKRDLSEMITLTGVTESSENNNVNIYPNPSKGDLVITLENYKDASAEIFNVEGKLMLSVSLQNPKTAIQADGLANGLYFIRIKNSDGLTTKKLIKN